MERRRFADRASEEIAHEATVPTSCFWCEVSHPAKHPLSVCPACVATARIGSFPVGSLEMKGSYPLTTEAIGDRMLTRKSPGNYALGYMDDFGGSVGLDNTAPPNRG